MNAAFRLTLALAMAFLGTVASGPAQAQARASFMNPSSARTVSSDGKSATLPTSVIADPAQVDAGETLVNIARRMTVFFYNGYRSPVTISSLSLNADGNVRSKIVADDCSTLKSLPVSDRCSVAVEVTPGSPGPWTVELLLNHSGQGRITRAEIVGTTLGKTGDKTEGLAISKKIAAPLDFGTINAVEERATRTMLIENDSNDPLVISTIDLISQQGDGLSLRSTGCKEGDSLKPGESCPITVIWTPLARGSLATDLIVRHSGNLGFVVVPIRGIAKGDETTKGTSLADGSRPNAPNTGALVPLQPRAGDAPSAVPSLGELVQSLPLLKGASGSRDSAAAAKPMRPQDYAVPFMLIGTVGGRAILGSDNQETTIIGLGETASVSGYKVELLQLDASRAVVNVEGVRRELSLRKAVSFIPGRTANSDSEGGPGAHKTGGPAAPETSPTPGTSSPAAPPGAGAKASGAPAPLAEAAIKALSAQDIAILK